MDHRANIITGAVVACFSLLLSACADSGADKAGERQGRDPTILTFANVALGLPAQLDVYAREVEALSGGTLRIEFHNHWRPNSTTFEIDTIDDVRAGEVDMAWVGARAFDVVGVTSFQALLAPMLVDSYDLQAAVFEAGIPDRMLGGLRSTGLEGIGVLPSPMERIMGISHAFVNPADFEGEVVGTVRSALGEQTFEALGATPQWGVANSKNATAGLDATNASLLNIFRLSGERAGRGFTTANLNLWPRPLVLFMEADRFAALAPEHRDILRTAAANAIEPALAAARAEDAEASQNLCRGPMTVVEANASDLAALRQALEPVYAALEQDPETRAFLDEIRALDDRIAAPAETFTCPLDGKADSSDAGGSGFPEGRFEMLQTRQDVIDSGCEGETAEDALIEVVFDSGTVDVYYTPGGRGGPTFFEGSLTYEVFRDRIEVREPTGTLFTARWSFDGTHLTFTDIESADCAAAASLGRRPWVLVDPGEPAAPPGEG